MARKTAKIYRKEYQDLLDKTKAMRARIIKRAKEMIIQFPDAPVAQRLHEDEGMYTAKEYPFAITPQSALQIIEAIEKHNEKQSGYVQEEIVFNKPELKDFIEYEDNGDDYEHPERKEVAEILEIRLYCMHDDFNCNKYIKGKEGYNGAFTAETGQRCDLRNQGFKCTEHGGGDED